MAASKKTPVQAPSNDLDLSKYVPDGFDLSDFDVVGGLRPVCPPEVNQDNPVTGWIVALLDMPKRKSDGSEWRAILVQLTRPAKAKAGDDVVDVEAGKEILIPLSGSLKNNADLLNAAVDARKVTMGMFVVTGTMDIGKPSDMWVYEVRLALKKQIAREGAFALYNKPVVALQNGFDVGNITDRNGQPARLVG